MIDQNEKFRVIAEQYRILTKYLNLLVDEKDFISKDDIRLILEALQKNIFLVSEEVEENE